MLPLVLLGCGHLAPQLAFFLVFGLKISSGKAPTWYLQSRPFQFVPYLVSESNIWFSDLRFLNDSEPAFETAYLTLYYPILKFPRPFN